MGDQVSVVALETAVSFDWSSGRLRMVEERDSQLARQVFLDNLFTAA
jgi:hypothetical protein